MDQRQEVPSKLAVLLHADVVDSTALVRADESRAHRRIRDGSLLNGNLALFKAPEHNELLLQGLLKAGLGDG